MTHTISYREDLIERLQDPEYAAIYLEEHLKKDEYKNDPELFKLALSNVLVAFGKAKRP